MDRVYVDIWENHIFSRLNDKTIIALSGVCSNLRKIFNKDELWTRLLWSRWIVANVDAIDIFNLNFSRDTYISLWKEYDLLFSNDFTFERRKNKLSMFSYVDVDCNICNENHATILRKDLPGFIPLYFYNYLGSYGLFRKTFYMVHPCTLYENRKEMRTYDINKSNSNMQGGDLRNILNEGEGWGARSDRAMCFSDSQVTSLFSRLIILRFDKLYSLQMLSNGGGVQKFKKGGSVKHTNNNIMPIHPKRHKHQLRRISSTQPKRSNMHQRNVNVPRYGNSRRYCNNYK